MLVEIKTDELIKLWKEKYGDESNGVLKEYEEIKKSFNTLIKNGLLTYEKAKEEYNKLEKVWQYFVEEVWNDYITDYESLDIEQRKLVYRDYVNWFITLDKKEQESIDWGYIPTFEEYDEEISFTNIGMIDRRTMTIIAV